jgi:hypothetical protein
MNCLEQLAGVSDLHVQRQPDGIYLVRFNACEAKRGAFLEGLAGRGATIDAAARDYMDQILGKTLVFHAMSPDRREVLVLGIERDR